MGQNTDSGCVHSHSGSESPSSVLPSDAAFTYLLQFTQVALGPCLQMLGSYLPVTVEVLACGSTGAQWRHLPLGPCLHCAVCLKVWPVVGREGEADWARAVASK